VIEILQRRVWNLVAFLYHSVVGVGVVSFSILLFVRRARDRVDRKRVALSPSSLFSILPLCGWCRRLTMKMVIRLIRRRRRRSATSMPTTSMRRTPST
jgi:hypothetical protein